MKNEYEIIRHSKIRHINAFVINIIYRNFHMHSDFELLLILEGTGAIQIKNDLFVVKTGDALLLNPNEMHEIDTGGKGITAVILQFSRHFGNDYFPFLRNTRFQTGNLKSCFNDKDYQEFLWTVTRLTASYITGGPLFEFQCVGLLINFLLLCCRNLNYEVLTENDYDEYKRKSDRMNRISSYIDENYLFPIRLKELAQAEHVTATHLSHFFSDNFGVTFQEYLSGKRLEQALRLSADKTLSLAELSDRSGFSDPKYLNKAFREKFGYPFREYRKSANQVTDLPQPENSQALQSYCSIEKSLELIGGFQRFLKQPGTDAAFIASVSTSAAESPGNSAEKIHKLPAGASS